MRRVDVEPVALERFKSTGVTIHHPTSSPDTLFAVGGPASMVVAELTSDGVIGRHPATGQQLLFVSSGRVHVCGNDGDRQELSAGEAVVFDPAEEHETQAITAATLAILEDNFGGSSPAE